MPVQPWEKEIYDQFQKEGSKIPLNGDQPIHKEIRACTSADDLKKLVTKSGGLDKLDNRSLALIIEGSGCENVIAAYVDYANFFKENVSEFLDNRKFLLNSAKFVFTTPEFSSDAVSQFRGGKRNAQ